MKILQLLKHDMADVRAKMAAGYRNLRRQNPAKARILFKRMNAAKNLTERQLEDNLFYQSRPIFPS